MLAFQHFSERNVLFLLHCAAVKLCWLQKAEDAKKLKASDDSWKVFYTVFKMSEFSVAPQAVALLCHPFLIKV